MGVLSVCEMWLHNALDHGAAPVTLAFAGGAGAYCLLAPLLPEVSTGGRWGVGGDDEGEKEGGSEGKRRKKVEEKAPVDASEKDKLSSAAKGGASGEETPPPPPPPPPLKPAQLLRLGLVVAVAMTAHNLPEGFAVAFSSFTPLGPAMAWAIAAHNIPEGVVVAAPVYAVSFSFSFPQSRSEFFPLFRLKKKKYSHFFLSFFSKKKKKNRRLALASRRSGSPRRAG